MSNLIAFLESLGRDVAVPAHGEGFVAAVKAAELDDRAEAALLSGNASALNDLLGGRAKMMCLLFPADGDEKKDGEEPAEEAPDEDEEKIGFGSH